MKSIEITQAKTAIPPITKLVLNHNWKAGTNFILQYNYGFSGYGDEVSTSKINYNNDNGIGVFFLEIRGSNNSKQYMSINMEQMEALIACAINMVNTIKGEEE